MSRSSRGGGRRRSSSPREEDLAMRSSRSRWRLAAARPSSGVQGPTNVRPTGRSTLPNSAPHSPRQGRSANLSTVAMRKAGSSRTICSSTKRTGRPPWRGLNSQPKSAQPTSTSTGLFWLGTTAMQPAVSGRPHHGHAASGHGDRLGSAEARSEREGHAVRAGRLHRDARSRHGHLDARRSGGRRGGGGHRVSAHAEVTLGLRCARRRGGRPAPCSMGELLGEARPFRSMGARHSRGFDWRSPACICGSRRGPSGRSLFGFGEISRRGALVGARQKARG